MAMVENRGAPVFLSACLGLPRSLREPTPWSPLAVPREVIYREGHFQPDHSTIPASKSMGNASEASMLSKLKRGP